MAETMMLRMRPLSGCRLSKLRLLGHFQANPVSASVPSNRRTAVIGILEVPVVDRLVPHSGLVSRSVLTIALRTIGPPVVPVASWSTGRGTHNGAQPGSSLSATIGAGVQNTAVIIGGKSGDRRFQRSRRPVPERQKRGS